MDLESMNLEELKAFSDRLSEINNNLELLDGNIDKIKTVVIETDSLLDSWLAVWLRVRDKQRMINEAVKEVEPTPKKKRKASAKTPIRKVKNRK